MITQVKLLIVLLLITIAEQTSAQTIDSFHVNRSVTPHELFVRLHFPDSSYYIERTFDRVALIYPPVNVTTFFYRSCPFVKTNPTRDTVIYIYSPEPYGIRLYLAMDANTSRPGCTSATQTQAIDSAAYTSPPTGIMNPVAGNSTLLIFPNPAAAVLHIIGPHGTELRIADVLGRMQLLQQLQNEKETININQLAPGLYYVHCFRDGQLLQSHCFSKLP